MIMNKTLHRRDLFRLGLGAMGMLGVGTRLARWGRLNAQVPGQVGDYKAIVCVFLAGGNDSNNLLVPIQTALQGYADYRAVRGAALGLKVGDLNPISTSGGDIYGLHPALAALQSLYLRNRMAVVANVGTLFQPLTKDQYAAGGGVPANLFSHSNQQQQWQTTPGGSTGWGGRVADTLQSVNAPSTFPIGVSMAGNSLFLSGQASTPAAIANGGLTLEGSDGRAASNARDKAFQQLLSFNSGMSLVQTLNQNTANGLWAGKILTSAVSGSSGMQTVFPQTGLGIQLQQVAQIMNARAPLGMKRQVFFVSQGGYDTHTNQLVQQAGLYSELAGALTAFDSATQELGLDGQVVAFTESEFGRTFQPSTGAGSDHAWGGHHLIIGSAVQSADVYGTFPHLAIGGPDDVSQRGVWLPTTSLDQYAATIASWFGVPDVALPVVFPNLANFRNSKLGYLKA